MIFPLALGCLLLVSFLGAGIGLLAGPLLSDCGGKGCHAPLLMKP